ncbi:MAG TPA: transposase [Haliangiales bacterium]|nr:transposase [Haliangiales bacterium]
MAYIFPMRRTGDRTAQKQLDFGFRTPRRRRRGRPPKPGSGVPHLPRSVHARFPLHVTLRVKQHVWQLRSRRCFRVLERAFRAAAARFDTRIAQFSVQWNHIHVVVETRDARALARAVQGMAIRMAKGLNRVMGRKGTVFADRYHSRALRTPTEVRKALVYVLGNARKHLAALGYKLSPSFLDEYSSAAWFDGWAVPPTPPPGDPPVAPARTWLLTTGWRDRGGGPLRRDEMPHPNSSRPAPAARSHAQRIAGSPRLRRGPTRRE